MLLQIALVLVLLALLFPWVRRQLKTAAGMVLAAGVVILVVIALASGLG